MLLNALSTCTMVRLGRVLGNRMIWVVPSNLKLIDRSTRYIQDLAGASYEDACHALFEVIEYVEPRRRAGQAYPAPVGVASMHLRHGLSLEEARSDSLGQSCDERPPDSGDRVKCAGDVIRDIIPAMRRAPCFSSSAARARRLPGPRRSRSRAPPNILFAIADDVSYPHMGAYGTSWVSTPAFDRVAREGVLFNRAYTPNAKCAPSRSIILTGRHSWQLGAAANHWPYFPQEYRTYAEALADHGYHVGYTGKGWGAGRGRRRATGSRDSWPARPSRSTRPLRRPSTSPTTTTRPTSRPSWTRAPRDSPSASGTAASSPTAPTSTGPG